MSNTNSIRLSVIIPFFNAQRYISRCVHSLMSQTHAAGLEFIFVDDCSTDQSADIVTSIVAAYPQRKGQVRMIRNRQNRGVAYSRQQGLDAARGEFVIHCDADDWVDAEMYSDMLRVADSTGADVVCTPYFCEKEKKTQIVAFPSLDFPNLNDMPLDTLHCSLWNKIIRRRIITDNSLRFFDGIDCWEDLGLWIRVAIKTSRIVVCNKPYYHYRRQSDTTLSSADMKRVLTDHLRLSKAVDEWFQRGQQSLSRRYSQFLSFLHFTAKIKLMRGSTRNLSLWKSTYPESNRPIMQYANIPYLYRVCFYLADRLPQPLVRTAIRIASLF